MPHMGSNLKTEIVQVIGKAAEYHLDMKGFKWED